MKILMAAMGLDIGGAETHIVELTRELARQGHEVIVASNGGVYVPEIESAGARHIEVPMNRRRPGPMLRSLRLLKKIIKTEKPDVVHAHARIPAFLCGILKRSMGFTLVTTAHWVFDARGVVGRLTNWGDMTVAVSEDIREYLVDTYGIPRDRIIVTINGIDTDKFSPEISGDRVRRELGIPLGAVVVSHVSRLDESRAMAASALIEIAPKLADRVPGVVILIAGGGDREQELSVRAAEANLKLGYKCVVLAGPRTDVNEICAAGDVFVGVSRAALEAMAVGRPVVVAGNEGYMGLFDRDKLDTGIEGNFCCRGCPELERRALLDDLTNALTLDSDECERLSLLGRQVIMENYSVRRMADDTVAAYRAAIPPKRVVLSGYYGFNNAGDEAILESICRTVRHIDRRIEVTVLSRNPKGTAERYGCRAIPRFSPVSITREIKKCDLLVSGGGSLLQDSTSNRSFRYYAWVLGRAQKAGKRTCVYANGIGPVSRPGNRELTRRLVERCDGVSLRDADSLRELREMGVTREDIEVTADPVFAMDMPDPEKVRQILRRLGVRGDYITVSVRPYKGEPGYFEKFAGVLDGIAESEGVEVVLIPMQPKRDGPISWTVRDLMRHSAHVLSGDYTPDELMGVIGGSRMVLSMRLHALIFAGRTATPALGFAYDPKVESCLAMLHQPSAGDSGHIDERACVAAAGVILRRREEIVERLAVTRDGLAAEAMKNNEMLRRLLTDRSGKDDKNELN